MTTDSPQEQSTASAPRCICNESTSVTPYCAVHSPGMTDLMVPPESIVPRGQREPRELLCMICGKEHPVWFAPNDLWNRVMRREDGSDLYPFVCPTCFMLEAQRQGYEPIYELRAPTTRARCEARTLNPCNSYKDFSFRCATLGEVHAESGLVLCSIHRRRRESGRQIEPCFVECGPECVCPPIPVRAAEGREGGTP